MKPIDLENINIDIIPSADIWWEAGAGVRKKDEGIVGYINRVATELQPIKDVEFYDIVLRGMAFSKQRASKSWNQNPNFFADFKAGKYKDRHPVTLELLDYE